MSVQDAVLPIVATQKGHFRLLAAVYGRGLTLDLRASAGPRWRRAAFDTAPSHSPRPPRRFMPDCLGPNDLAFCSRVVASLDEDPAAPHAGGSSARVTPTPRIHRNAQGQPAPDEDVRLAERG